jgi:hypothetical protein
MNGGIDPVFYALVCGATLWLALLWAGTSWRVARRHRAIQGGCAAATLLLLFVPFGGMPLWNWAFSFCPNPSLPMLGMVCAALWSRLGGVAVFKPEDWRLLIGFGAIAGTVLYLHPFARSGFDLYYWGWHHDVAVWSMAALALTALAFGNRAGVLFLAGLIAYELQALESHNGWDYLVDPIFWLICLGLSAVHGVRRLVAGRALRRASRSPFAAASAMERVP